MADTMRDDLSLLQGFVERRSGEDFAELVRRHLGLVFATALRRVGGDTHLAEDVAQSVFIDLARRAPALGHVRVLAGWLYTSTLYAAAKVVRTEQRRRQREEKAHAMQEFQGDPAGNDAAWERVRPVLDDALRSLSPRDRDAVLLRFFHGQGFAVIGATLDISENGARMRVDRALDKLRAQLARRGIVSSVAALGTTLSAHAAVATPPAALAAGITTAAIAGASGAGITATLFNLLAMTKIQLGLTAAVVAVGATTLALEHREQSGLRDTLAHTTALADESARLQTEIDTLEQTIGQVRTMRAHAAELIATRRALRELQEQRARLDARLNSGAPPAASSPSSPASSNTAAAPLDQMPRAVSAVSPQYPFDLKKAGIPGEVIIAFTVDAEGKVKDPVVVETTHPGFSAPALQAVRLWRFAPGKKGGQVVNTRLQAPVVFEIQDPNWF